MSAQHFEITCGSSMSGSERNALYSGSSTNMHHLNLFGRKGKLFRHVGAGFSTPQEAVVIFACHGNQGSSVRLRFLDLIFHLLLRFLLIRVRMVVVGLTAACRP